MFSKSKKISFVLISTFALQSTPVLAMEGEDPFKETRATQLQLGHALPLNDLIKAEKHYLKGNMDALELSMEEKDPLKEEGKAQLRLGHESRLNDLTTAEEHYLKALELGNKNALEFLVTMYNPINTKKAKSYAQMGLNQGLSEPAKFYAFYQIAHNNIEEANPWLQKAVTLGNTEAAANLSFELMKVDQEKSEKLARIAARDGHALGIRVLGTLYEHSNPELSKKCFDLHRKIDELPLRVEQDEDRQKSIVTEWYREEMENPQAHLVHSYYSPLTPKP